MSFRVVLIENETKLQLRLNSLIVQKEEKEIWIRECPKVCVNLQTDVR